MASRTSNQAQEIKPIKVGHGVTFWGKTPNGSEVYIRAEEKDGLNRTVCYLMRGQRQKIYTHRRNECIFGAARRFVLGTKKDLFS